MKVEDFQRRMAAAGGALLPFQVHAVQSTAAIVALVGDYCTGKTTTLAPWMLSRDPSQLHGITAPTEMMAILAFNTAFLTLDNIGCSDHVAGRRPPKEWAVDETVSNFRNVLTLRTGASFVLLSARSKRWSSYRLGSLFIDDADATGCEIEPGQLQLLVQRATQTTITAVSEGVIAARLPGWSIEFVYPTVNRDRRLVGELAG